MCDLLLEGLGIDLNSFFLIVSAEKDNGRGNDESSEEKEEEDFNYLSSLVASGQSRLASEFDLLKVLGKGGFGDVLKVSGTFFFLKKKKDNVHLSYVYVYVYIYFFFFFSFKGSLNLSCCFVYLPCRIA